MISFDLSEVRQLAVDLREMPASVIREIPRVLEKGAVNIKDQLRSEMGSSVHFRGTAKSITYDMHDAGMRAEIGPDKNAGGAIANIAYFGGGAWTGRRKPGPGWQQGPGGGGTVPDPRGALDAEAPSVEREILDLVARVMGR